MPIKSLKKNILKKKTEGILLLDITKDFEGYHFFATGFYLYTLIKNLTFLQWRTKFSPCVSKLNDFSEEYLSPQRTQKAAVYFSRKNLGLRIF